jgi:glycosyltransferase involved in cell wall biosynthesis
MKILYITNPINVSGGLERALALETDYLINHYKCEISILTINDGHKNLFYHFNNQIKMQSMYVDGNPFSYYFAYRKGILNAIETIKPDIIQVWDDGLKGMTIPLIINSKIPIIYIRQVSLQVDMQHDFSWIKKKYINLKWKLMQSLAKTFDAMAILTENTRKEWPGVKNLVVIPNPLAFFPENSSTNNSKKVIAVGRHVYQKGYDRLIDAWKIVNQKHPDWVLDIYGHKDKDNFVSKLVKESNLESSINLLDPVKNIDEKYTESSIFVLSSRYEGFGLVIIEAMACGLPVVSFDCPFGPSEIIKENEDGFLIEDGNIKEFASKISLLIESQELRTIMGKTARENVKVYETSYIADKFYNLMKRFIKN